jgi:hypothetical protein
MLSSYNVSHSPAYLGGVRRLLVAVALVIAVALIGAAGARAATFTVTDTTDAALGNSAGTGCVSTHGGSCTLRAAVQAADNTGGASTITLPEGEFKLEMLSTAEDEPANGDLDIKGTSTAITLTGAGASNTVINANHIDRAFAVQSGKTLTVSGLTVENGKQTGSGSGSDSSVDGYGGAFLNLGTLTIDGSVLTGNDGGDAGGVINAEGSGATSILDSTIEGNSSEGEGGVLSAYGGSVTLTGDTIRDNKAAFGGGAIYVNEPEGETAPVEVERSTLSNNEAGGTSEGAGGGAIYVIGQSPLTVADSTFDGDSAGARGGAIRTYLGNLSVSESTFHGDHAEIGGALLINGFENTIMASTFSDDEATGNGGAILISYGRLNAFASTFSADKASSGGGAIMEQNEEGLELTNDTFTGNESPSGGALNLPGDNEEPLHHSLLLNDTIARNSATDGGGLQIGSYRYYGIENTIVALNTGGDCQSAGSEDSAGEADKGGNIDGDGSCFSDLVMGDQTGVNPLFAPLASYGGPTETLALLAGSPAVDSGLQSPEACPTTDQRGVVRTGGCDVGAYQGVYTPPVESLGTGSGSGSTTTAATAATSPVVAPALSSAKTEPQCRSERQQRIHWNVPRGVDLARLRVTLDGHPYRALALAARELTVSLVGLPKGTVTIRVIANSRSGARYGMTRTFHTCVASRPPGAAGSDYLRRL